MVSFGSLSDVGYKALATGSKSIYSVAFGTRFVLRTMHKCICNRRILYVRLYFERMMNLQFDRFCQLYLFIRRAMGDE
jgi:hypothetical protein